MKRYKCHTGHAHTLNELLLKQSEALEETLWIALRSFEERKNLLDKMAKEESDKGWMKIAIRKTEMASELGIHIKRLKEILFQPKDQLASIVD